jgi:hypothetical protein
MTNRERLAYLAGIVDGEGYVGLKRSQAYGCQGRRTPGFHERLQVRMVDEPAIKMLADTLGGWYYKEKPNAAKGRPLYCYQASDLAACVVLRKLLPFLSVKARQAKAVLAFRDDRAGWRKRMEKSGDTKRAMYPPAVIAEMEERWMAVKEMNHVGI